jgi:hypothetical protein
VNNNLLDVGADEGVYAGVVEEAMMQLLKEVRVLLKF